MPKKTHFPKGIIHRFCPKIEIFVICVFWGNQVRKYCFLILWIKKKNDFYTRKIRFLKVQTSRFAKRDNPRFLSKSQTFSYLFFWIKQISKDHFLIFWIEKNDFYTRKLKFYKVQKTTFFWGVSPWVLSKNRTFFIWVFLV